MVELPSAFGGFAPFPNSIMIPFMGAQSAVLAYNFGIDYETGKRTLKSLPNDFFNRIRAGDDKEITVVYDGKEIVMKTSEYIPFLKRQNAIQAITMFRELIPDFKNLQRDIIEQSVELEKMKAERTPSAMAEMIDSMITGLDDTALGKLNDWLNQHADPLTLISSIITANPLLGTLLMFVNAGLETSTAEEPPKTCKEDDAVTQTPTWQYTDSEGKEYSYDSQTGNLLHHEDRLDALINNNNNNPQEHLQYFIDTYKKFLIGNYCSWSDKVA